MKAVKTDMLLFIVDALGVSEQEFFTNDKKQSDRILKRLYNNKLRYKYKEIIELLEYLSPKSLETLKDLLIKNKENTEKLKEIIK